MSNVKQAFRRNFRDADLRKTIALPAAASTTVATAAVDTGNRTNRSIPADDVEVVVVCPALSTVILPDTRTMTLSIEASDDSAFGSGVQVLRTATMVGAGGVGAVRAEVRAALPEDCPRYLRGKFVSGASATDASALAGEIALLCSGD